ncbi:MAG TPA: KR domain-containing protein, partial [Gemmatimonadaceae bacterium]
VHVASGDVSVRADVERVLSEIERTMPPLRGVIHAAGVLDDGVLSAQTRERFATVMAPKVLGTWHLHSLAGALDFLVLFSSGASLAGSPGQANHAAANAFEDALAFYRQSQGQPTVSINWGPWAEIGAAAERGITTADFVDAIAPRDGLLALEWAMRRIADGVFGHSQVGVLATDWPRLLAQYQGRVPAFFSDMAVTAKRQATATSGDGHAMQASLLDRLQSAAPNRRRTILLNDVRAHTIKVLGLAESDPLDVTEPLRQLGLDSLMAVELRNLLGRAVGRTLPATVTFDHPTVEALVDHLAKHVFAEQLSEAARPTPLSAPLPPNAPDAAAIDDLSEAELAQRLLSKLERMG